MGTRKAKRPPGQDERGQDQHAQHGALNLLRLAFPVATGHGNTSGNVQRIASWNAACPMATLCDPALSVWAVTNVLKV